MNECCISLQCLNHLEHYTVYIRDVTVLVYIRVWLISYMLKSIIVKGRVILIVSLNIRLRGPLVIG